MIINGDDLILGRVASFAAKKALLGETIDIVNCEKIAVTGRKEFLLKRYKQIGDRGTHKGPIFHRSPVRILKRTIRGMLPYKQERGIKAFKRIKCYVGVPAELKDKKLDTIANANVSKLKNLNFIYVKDISKFLGGKI